MPLIFQNNGVIDRKSITAFGVSSKENPGAIGYFGTGLKYAIAVLLRNNCKITIFAGKDKLEFGTTKRKLRVNDFSFVTMNRRALDFTTEVGKNWELWMAYRELYCNATDEGGEVYVLPAPLESSRDDSTTIVVEGARFEAIHDARESIILSSKPIIEHPALNVHPGRSNFIYYKGVRVMELSQPSLYTYNLQGHATLTEDRTLSYFWEPSSRLKSVVASTTNKTFILDVVTAPQDTFEHALTFENVNVGEVFAEVVTTLAKSFDTRLNKAAVAACRTMLSNRFKDSAGTELSELDKKRLARAVSFCRQLGFPVSEYPIHTSEYLGAEVLGMAAMDERVIYLSKRAFMLGTKVLAGTLLEEYLHLKHNLLDESRGMQNFLIDTLMSLGERVTGEPL